MGLRKDFVKEIVELIKDDKDITDNRVEDLISAFKTCVIQTKYESAPVLYQKHQGQTNEDKILIDNTLVTILSEESKYVGIVVRYIVDNIPYNVNHITLSSVDIAKIYNVDKGNISRAIKRLNELNVIGRLYDKIPNPYLPKNTYVINHNYLYRGSIRKLRKDILEQRQKENESKD